MERDLGYRRVQSTGRGSYIISLPKEWAQETGVGKGSEVAFKLRDDSSLILVPGKMMEEKGSVPIKELKDYWVYVHEKDNARSVCRKVISLYVVNADLIHIRFRDNLHIAEYKAAINDLVKSTLLGAEIIDESDNVITIQILVNHPEFPVEKAIRRMTILALSANETAVSALNKEDGDSVREVAESKSDVARLNLYVVRQLKFGLEMSLFKELGFRNPKEFLGYRIVVNDIKSVADNAMIITRNIKNLKKMIKDQTLFLKENVDEEAYSQILELNSLAHKSFEESLSAMFGRDYEHADNILSQMESLAIQESDLTNIISSKKLDPNVSSVFSLVLDNSRRIMEYTVDIAEVTLNRTIEEISERNSQPHS
jgi:phosphate uptake regulator